MTKEIPLTNGLVAIVDDADWDRCSRFTWYARRTANGFRARHAFRTQASSRHVDLGRFILGEPTGMVVDHINGDRLDNRRDNLRICTHRENTQNRSPNRDRPIKGASLGPYGRWRAIIRVDDKLKHLGFFDTAEAAGRAYDAAAKVAFGEFARLNFPDAQVSA